MRPRQGQVAARAYARWGEGREAGGRAPHQQYNLSSPTPFPPNPLQSLKKRVLFYCQEIQLL